MKQDLWDTTCTENWKILMKKESFWTRSQNDINLQWTCNAFHGGLLFKRELGMYGLQLHPNIDSDSESRTCFTSGIRFLHLICPEGKKTSNFKTISASPVSEEWTMQKKTLFIGKFLKRFVLYFLLYAIWKLFTYVT